MDTETIFLMQFVLSIVAWGIVAAMVLSPRLARIPRFDALALLSLPHIFRHVGMSFLVRGVNLETLPPGFANMAAYGDLAAGLLAMVAVVALRSRWALAIPATWLFNVVGSVDLANALRHEGVMSKFGATWYIPTMLVPLLLVTHFMIFRRLLAK